MLYIIYDKLEEDYDAIYADNSIPVFRRLMQSIV